MSSGLYGFRVRKLLRFSHGRPVRRAAASAALAVCLVAVLLLTVGGGSDHGDRPSASTADGTGAIRDSEAAQSFPESGSATPHELAESPEQAAASATPADDTGPSPGAPSDAEVRRDLRRLERYQRRARAGGSIKARGDHARAPTAAPISVADLVSGGNAIATFPYRLGGGHGSFVDNAYDCSGSVSYALAAAGLVQSPLTSGEFMKWGEPGRGRWLTVYANPGHVFMTVGGLRFDTSGRAGRRGSRWQNAERATGHFAARHWPGL
jgi:cell wall-associated NlpC family hydrolase